MNLFSKNNYKYFIGFLIAFIFIILVYGNYNLKINVIENSQNMSVTMSDTRGCSNTNNVNNTDISTVAAPLAELAVHGAGEVTAQLKCDKQKMI